MNKLVMSLGDKRLVTHENAKDKEDEKIYFFHSTSGYSIANARGKHSEWRLSKSFAFHEIK